MGEKRKSPWWAPLALIVMAVGALILCALCWIGNAFDDMRGKK